MFGSYMYMIRLGTRYISTKYPKPKYESNVKQIQPTAHPPIPARAEARTSGRTHTRTLAHTRMHACMHAYITTGIHKYMRTYMHTYMLWLMLMLLLVSFELLVPLVFMYACMHASERIYEITSHILFPSSASCVQICINLTCMSPKQCP